MIVEEAVLRRLHQLEHALPFSFSEAHVAIAIGEPSVELEFGEESAVGRIDELKDLAEALHIMLTLPHPGHLGEEKLHEVAGLLTV